MSRFFFFFTVAESKPRLALKGSIQQSLGCKGQSMRKVGGDLQIKATKCGLESLFHEALRMEMGGEVKERPNLKRASREYDQLK